MRIVILLIFISSIAYGETGLSVEPGSLLIQHVTLGRTYDLFHDLNVPIVIRHKGDSPCTYCLSTHKPSEIGKLVEGYTDIFDPSWLWFDKNEVTILPNGSATIQMYLRVPKDDRFYNQHWTVGIKVESKPEYGKIFVLGVISRIHLETEINEDIGIKPDGLLGVCPARIKIGGKNKKAMLRIFNNDKKKHQYQLRVFVPNKNARHEQINISPKFNWIPDTGWIKVNHQRIVIGQGKSRNIKLQLSLPDGKKVITPWEALLMVQPDEGVTGFVRVQIEE